jgi:hypothetical protein
MLRKTYRNKRIPKRKVNTTRKDLLNLAQLRINVNPNVEEEIELRAATPPEEPGIMFNKGSLSKTLITPEKQFEMWKAKKQPDQNRKELLPMFKTLPLIEWGEKLMVNSRTYTLVNTCPIGEKQLTEKKNKVVHA